jgi:hypothetical protein
MNPVRKIPQPNVNTQIKFDDVDNQVVYLDDTITTLSASFDERINIISSSGGGGTTPTGSLLVTASAGAFDSDINFIKGDGSSFTITTANDKISTGSVTLNTLTFTKGDGSTFNLTVDTGSIPTTDTGSFLKTGSVSLNTLTFTKGDGTTFNLTVNTGSGTTIDTGSFLKTGSANAFNSDITFTKGDGSTFTITTANDKLNSAGGNTYSGDQTLTSGKFTINDSVATPVLQGKANAKTDINYNQTAPIFTFTSGAYSALIIDGYVIGSNYPDYYSIQKVTAIPTTGDISATQPYNFTVVLDINSPSASADYNFIGDKQTSILYPATFGTGSLQFSSDYESGNARILITNLCKTKLPGDQDINITYRTIVKAFPSI